MALSFLTDPTIPYITADRLGKVTDQLEKDWQEWKEDPNMLFKALDMGGANLTPMGKVTVTGIYSKVSTSNRPTIVHNFKVNNEPAPMFMSISEAETYSDGTTTRTAYKLQCSMGILYIFYNDTILWITKYVAASAVIASVTKYENLIYTQQGDESLVQLLLTWKDTLDTDAKRILAGLDITVVYRRDDGQGGFQQYVTQARSVTTTGIYTLTFDEPRTEFTVADFYLYAGNAATI